MSNIAYSMQYIFALW